MSDLDQALVSIRSIRRQMAETTVFRGYGPATLLGTAAMALIAGGAQYRWIDKPAAHPTEYVAIWLATAVLSAALIATQMLARAPRLHTCLADEMVRLAVLHFLPAGVAGAILPFVLLRLPSSVFWMLPGLWQIIFSLGVFASCRCLPRAMLLVGVWFLLIGFASISLGDARALEPGTMAFGYALGMALVASIQHRSAKDWGSDEGQDV